jgi:hypothetical protein
MKIGSNTSKKMKTTQHWYLEIFIIIKINSQGVIHGKTLISSPFQENQ